MYIKPINSSSPLLIKEESPSAPRFPGKVRAVKKGAPKGGVIVLLILFTALIAGCCKCFKKTNIPVLTSKDNVLLKDGKPYKGIGVNYFDPFIRTFDSPADTNYREGFKELAKRKIPFARVPFCGFWASEMKSYFENKEEYFKRLDDVVDAAEESGIGLIPCVFWYYACFPDLVGEPMNQWGNPESKTIAFMKKYTEEVVTRYKNSPAIWAWEFGNEYLLETGTFPEHRPWILPQFGTPANRTEADDITFDQVLVAYKEFAKTVRSIDKKRLLITGDATPRPSAYNLHHNKSWKIDTEKEAIQNLIEATPTPYDFISVHFYQENHEPRFGMKKPLSEKKMFEFYMDAAKKAGKLLFVGEFGVSLESKQPDEKIRKQDFMRTVDAIVETGVPLSALWVFDFVNPTSNSFHEQRIIRIGNKFEWTLDVISKANKKIN